MIDANIETVVVVTLRWRRDKVLQWDVSIWQWIQSCDCSPDVIDPLRSESDLVGTAVG